MNQLKSEQVAKDINKRKRRRKRGKRGRGREGVGGLSETREEEMRE